MYKIYKQRRNYKKKFEASITQEIAKQMCGPSWEEDNEALDKYVHIFTNC
jgi:protein required for attachment to host cells